MQPSQPMLAPPIKRVGGKSRLRKQVIEYLPADAECYCEVFAGAGWVLFGKQPHPVEVLNDKDGDLVNLWRVLKWRNAELLEEVHKHLYSRDMFYELREQRPDGKDEIARAVWLYLLIQMSFGADVSNSGSASFGYRNKSPRDLFLYKSIDQFAPAKERLRGVFIENLDFQDLIQRYDQPRTIFYLDPPYLETCGYAVGFTEADHWRLATTLHNIEGRYLLTINDHPLIREMYKDAFLLEGVEPRGKSRAAEARQAAPILFISNYQLFQSQEQGSVAQGTNPQVTFAFD